MRKSWKNLDLGTYQRANFFVSKGCDDQKKIAVVNLFIYCDAGEMMKGNNRYYEALLNLVSSIFSHVRTTVTNTFCLIT